MAEVACLGILVADTIARPVEQMPERGKLVRVEEITLALGGCASNTGVGLARLGIATAVLGKVGRDSFGDFVEQTLRQEGIDTRGVARDEVTHTSATMVLVEQDGERRFIHYIGANASLTEKDVRRDVLAEAKILHVGGALLLPGLDGEPMARVLAWARQQGLITSFDTVWDATGRWLEILRPCLPHIDYFLPSIAEAREITGRSEPAAIAEFLLAEGVRVVGLKMGEEGCYVRTAEEEWRVPAYPVTAIDATGAGDAYVAGFLTGVVQGWDLQRTAQLANAAGACCITSLGATTGMRSLAETMKIMATGKLGN
jgi:sugar/nucleoside kinase (ribokinase family)